MTSSNDKLTSSPTPPGSSSNGDETTAQRERREADQAWEKSEKERREVEIKRRVKEDWRNPFN